MFVNLAILLALLATEPSAIERPVFDHQSSTCENPVKTGVSLGCDAENRRFDHCSSTTVSAEPASVAGVSFLQRFPADDDNPWVLPQGIVGKVKQQPTSVVLALAEDAFRKDRLPFFQFSICRHSLRTSILLPNERGTLTEYVRGGYQPRDKRASSVWPSKQLPTVSAPAEAGRPLTRISTAVYRSPKRLGGSCFEAKRKPAISDGRSSFPPNQNSQQPSELTRAGVTDVRDSTAPAKGESSKVWPRGGAK